MAQSKKYPKNNAKQKEIGYPNRKQLQMLRRCSKVSAEPSLASCLGLVKS